MGLPRQALDQFLVPDHGEQDGVGRGEHQRTVVVARTPAQPYSPPVHAQRGHQHEPGLAHGTHPEPRPNGFEDATQSSRDERAVVLGPLERPGRGRDHGQQHARAAFSQHVGQRLGPGFGPERQVSAYSAAGQRKRRVGQRGRLAGVRLGRNGGTRAEQPSPPLRLAHVLIAQRLHGTTLGFAPMTGASFPQTFRTAIVPAAGLGTRFLPATKAVPKELLPVVDTPGIELVASEAAAAGAKRLVIVTSPGKEAVVKYFETQPELEQNLKAKGKTELLAKVRRGPGLLDVETAIQEQALGLGHAVAQAEPNLTPEDEAVAVLLPDDLVLPVGVLERMSAVRAEQGGSVLCAFDIPKAEISPYGVFDVSDTDDPDVKRVHGMVEKPKPEDAPSTYAAAGRYLLDRAIFDALKRITPGSGGELQLTDAVALLIAEGHPVHIVVHRGGRHDLGNPGGFLRAAVDFALETPEYGPSLRAWLTQRIGNDRP